MRCALEDLADRRPVWAALASMFVDADVSLTRTARVAALAGSKYTLAELNQILTEEVYPVCWQTLQSDTGVGTEFDPVWLEAQILGQRPSPAEFANLIGLARLAVPRSREWRETAASLAGQPGRTGQAVL